MKTYLSVGIGDMMCLDSVLTQKERDNVTEIYWACRFGKDIIPLMENNIFYPNLKNQYIISDEKGMNAMSGIEPGSQTFWHFRPDFPKSYKEGLRLFNLENSKEDIWAVNAAEIFLDSERGFTNSSFIDVAKEEDVDWESLNITPKEYILFHYPTSSRPRNDIATINENDWNFVENLSKEKGLKIVIISDTEINRHIENSITLIKPNIKSVISLTKFSKYYAGCDSFVSILSAKVLPPENLFVKSHNPEIQDIILNHTWLQRFFLPHGPATIRTFYKNYIGI